MLRSKEFTVYLYSDGTFNNFNIDMTYLISSGFFSKKMCV